MKLQDLRNTYAEAVDKEDYDKIADVVSRLNNESPAFKKQAVEFYEQSMSTFLRRVEV